MVRRRFAAPTVAGFVGGIVVACTSSCASPTLPLPPPLAPAISQAEDPDHVTLTATCNPIEASLVIVVVNEGGGQPVPPGLAVGGAIADSCGAWQTEMFAHAGDALVITYQLNDQTSQPTVVTVRR